MQEQKKILVIDDQIGVEGSPSYLNFMDNYGKIGYQFVFDTAEQDKGVFSVSAALGAIEYYSDAVLVILDIKFGPESDRLGVEILSEAVHRFSDIPFIMMTSLDSEPATVVKCLRLGAKDYISKGATPEDLSRIIEKYARRVTESDPILGNSSGIKSLRSLIAKVAQNHNVSVLIQGERGTGKELVARNIHYLGRRRNAPLIAVNCASFPQQLLEAELFGAEKGAYTGAVSTKYGYFEIANGGVFFLDEIGEMDLSVQASLLRVLETRKFRRLGVSKQEISVDFQLICATNRDLGELVKKEKFRADLYDRIRGFEINTVPLRDCVDDIELLARHFLTKIQLAEGGTSYHINDFAPDVLEALRNYSWPGNVRQLRNVIEGAMIRASGDRIESRDLPQEIVKSVSSVNGSKIDLPKDGMNLNDKLARIELEYLEAAYEASGRNKSKTMSLFYPGYASNYFDRIVYEATQRSDGVIDDFPVFKTAYENEARRRGK